MARVVSVPISVELWQDLVTEGRTVEQMKCVQGLPEGAELIYDFYDGQRGATYLVFRHESFDDVRIGQAMPRIKIVHDYIYRDD